MKKHFQTLAGVGIAIVVFVLGISIINALSGCSPKINMPDIQIPEITTRPDTVIRTITTVQTDTVELAGYTVTVRDTVPCPAGLDRDTDYYVTSQIYLPGQKIITRELVHDTVRLVSALPAPGVIPTAGAEWPERLTWLSGVLLLLAALWRKWKAEQKQKEVLS
ncbi:MAG: hypothetical protein JNM22_01975 [Saprospiraceae bacterium]|nr:hypothetical protein [Saprospiraceae bacterium]